MNEYAQALAVSQAEPSERAAFIRKTYAHLAGAILAFIALETYMVNSPPSRSSSGTSSRSS